MTADYLFNRKLIVILIMLVLTGFSVKAESQSVYQFYDVKKIPDDSPLKFLEVKFKPASVPKLNLASSAIIGSILLSNTGDQPLTIRNPLENLDVQLIGFNGEPIDIKHYPPPALIQTAGSSPPFSAFALKKAIFQDGKDIEPESIDIITVPPHSNVELFIYPLVERFVKALPSLSVSKAKNLSIENIPHLRFITSLILVGNSTPTPGRIIRSDFIPLLSK